MLIFTVWSPSPVNTISVPSRRKYYNGYGSRFFISEFLDDDGRVEGFRCFEFMISARLIIL
jgi:hypothetical protein